MSKTNLYKGVFNYHGEIFTLYCYAVSLMQALKFFIGRLSKKLGISRYKLDTYFYAGDNFAIEVLRTKSSLADLSHADKENRGG